LVGGLPKEKKWPFCYKAPFSPPAVAVVLVKLVTASVETSGNPI